MLTNSLFTTLAKFYHGKSVRTHRHPMATKRHVAVLPLIGDLGAVRKVMATASISSDYNICSFCDATADTIDFLGIKDFTARVGVEVQAAAKESRRAPTKVKQKEIFKKKGVRWSPFHLLTYRDPVRHTLLGSMHNWFEGVLQHHVRVLWGLGSAPLRPQQTHDKDVAHVAVCFWILLVPLDLRT